MFRQVLECWKHNILVETLSLITWYVHTMRSGAHGHCVYISGNALLPVLQILYFLFPTVLKQYLLVVYQNIRVANLINSISVY